MAINASKPVIGLTMGDPAGVGPELILRAVSNSTLRESCCLVVFGNSQTLARCANKLGWPIPEFHVLGLTEFLSDRASVEAGGIITVVEAPAPNDVAFVVGEVGAACGKAAFAYIQAAMDAALADRIDAVTTAPINKEALWSAGFKYPGHTEMFAERAAKGPWCMMQYSAEITCTFVTVHVGYREVPQLLTTERILEVIHLTAHALRKIRRREPRLLVCGLNPHAGEHGLFGDGEEERVIAPAVLAARKSGLQIDGPVPPDTAFLPSMRRQIDAVVCMYHDQGHIPVKALAFDSAVNTTLGLGIIRTSVDHGTAFDIAWQGKADPGSLFAAIGLAADLSHTGASLKL